MLAGGALYAATEDTWDRSLCISSYNGIPMVGKTGHVHADQDGSFEYGKHGSYEGFCSDWG